jgi:hypothetical protein
MFEEIEPARVMMPETPGLMLLSFTIEDSSGKIFHRNFTAFRVRSEYTRAFELREADGRTLGLVRFSPEAIEDRKWSLKEWQVLDGLKINGAGAGYFEYRIPWPEDLSVDNIEATMFVAELGAKELFGKDMKDGTEIAGNFMLGKGTHDPSLNSNAYPMTDEYRSPSLVRISLNERVLGSEYLPDDPADHRGILSWHAQHRDRRLREAGSYGFLVKMPVPVVAMKKASSEGELKLRLEVDSAFPGGLAIYGKDFGRYPLDPTLVIVVKD